MSLSIALAYRPFVLTSPDVDHSSRLDGSSGFNFMMPHYSYLVHDQVKLLDHSPTSTTKLIYIPDGVGSMDDGLITEPALNDEIF